MGSPRTICAARASDYRKFCRCAKSGDAAPEQIVGNRGPYFDALDEADEACKKGQIDMSKMEGLLARLLANQLMSTYKPGRGQLNTPAWLQGRKA